ncbi:MAG: MFS transporter [Frankia sp.]
MLAVGLLATVAGCAFQFGLAALIPALRDRGLSLGDAGLLAACPTAGLIVALIAWGAAADRWGERAVLSTGLGLSGIVLLAGAAVASGSVRSGRGVPGGGAGGPGAGGWPALGAVLFLAGAAGASVHASSGRLILGWFAAGERGLAMGVRQTAQPLGIAVAALTLPTLAVGGLGGPLVFLGASCCAAAALVAVAVRNPARPAAAAASPRPNPYRSSRLWRIHGASALLVVPQFTVATFALIFLVDEQGWVVSTAGRVLAVAQVGGAGSRLLAGAVSDRLGSRLRPMRGLALAIAGVMVALGATAAIGSAVAVPILIAALMVSVSTNGLAFTAVAELAGGSWAGRALGIQNTAQNMCAAATPPLVAAAVDAAGYSVTFAVVAVFPLVAAIAIPMAGDVAFGEGWESGTARGRPGRPRQGGPLSRRRSVELAPHRTSCHTE